VKHTALGRDKPIQAERFHELSQFVASQYFSYLDLAVTP
jgi:hypothetical protein